MKRIIVLLIAVMVLGFTVTSHSSLTIVGADFRGNSLIYDSALNITWYDTAGGYKTWQMQADWTSGLTMKHDNNTYDGWRLPSTVNGGVMSPGYNGTSSEMGHLYYRTLGNTDWGLTNTGPFQHLAPSGYWSGADASSSAAAWYFYFNDGYQNENGKGASYRALAVHDGLVLPIPGTMALFGSGLAGVAAWVRMYRRRQE
jgi:hypothetical protein